MTTCRAIITDALNALAELAVGDNPTADELTTGLGALQAIILELHEARGALADIDVGADTVAGENQRLRIEPGATVSITLPNAVDCFLYVDPYDYGFIPPAIVPAQGTTGFADGVQYRAPRDGSRVEIVGTTPALYFYRADINSWMAAYGLSTDAESPLNARYNGPLAALTAERLIDSFPAATLTPTLERRVGRARLALLTRPGVARDPVIAEYL